MSPVAARIPDPSRIDRIIAAIAPGLAVKRQRNRVLLGFEAAQLTRLRGHSQVLSGPNSMRTPMDRLQVTMQVRDLEQNDGLFRSIISKVSLYAVGRLRYQAQTGNPEINKAYEAFLADKFKRCDYSGRHNFRQLAALTLQSMLRDGDFFWIYRQRAGQLYIQGIESDRVGGNVPTTSSPNYVQGVTFDPESGRVIAYRVYQRTLFDSYENPQEVDSFNMRQFYDPWRYDEYRGVSPFAPVVNPGRDLKEVKEATLIGVKIESYSGGFITGGNGQVNDSDPAYIMNSMQTGANGQPLTEEKMQPGQFRYLPGGTKVEFPTNSRPAGAWQSYVTMLVREVALALNLPYGFVYDLAVLNGPGARMDAQQAHRVIQGWQETLVDRGLDDAKNRFLLEGIASGELPYTPRWTNGLWKFPPAITIDAGRDSAAGINEVRAGLRTKADWYDEDGKDSEEQAAITDQEARDTIRRAKKISEDEGVSVSDALNLLEVRLPNGATTITVTDPDDDNDHPPLIAQIGIGGTQALAGIMAQVGAGQIPVAGGRSLLVSVFGMTREQAADALPEGLNIVPTNDASASAPSPGPM